MKNLVVAVLSLLTLASPVMAQTNPQPLHVLMVMNEGFRPEEYFIPRKIFDSAGFKTTVATRYDGAVSPSRNHRDKYPSVQSNLTYNKVDVRNYDAIIFVGGNGAWNDILPNTEAHRILLTSMQQNKIVGLICAATGLLATAGNLDGNTPRFRGAYVTGYPDVEGLLKRVGLLNYLPGTPGRPQVVVHRNLITARDPISAQMFGETVAQRLHKRRK